MTTLVTGGGIEGDALLPRGVPRALRLGRLEPLDLLLPN